MNGNTSFVFQPTCAFMNNFSDNHTCQSEGNAGIAVCENFYHTEMAAMGDLFNISLVHLATILLNDQMVGLELSH